MKNMRRNYSEKYEKFEHVPLSDAKKEAEEGVARPYLVTAINWTHATGGGVYKARYGRFQDTRNVRGATAQAEDPSGRGRHRYERSGDLEEALGKPAKK